MKKLLFLLSFVSLSCLAATTNTDELCLREGVDKVCYVSPALSANDSITMPADGTVGQIINTDGNGVWSFTNAGTGFANPMDSDGDMIYGGASGVATKLDSGTAGQLLVAAGAAAPAWTTMDGTYSPTLVAGTNTSAVTTSACNYKRVGNTVSVACRLPTSCTAASGTNTTFYIPLPIASDLDTSGDLNGTIASGQSGEVGIIFEDTSNDRATVNFNCETTGSNGRRGIFQYEVK